MIDDNVLKHVIAPGYYIATVPEQNNDRVYGNLSLRWNNPTLKEYLTKKGKRGSDSIPSKPLLKPMNIEILQGIVLNSPTICSGNISDIVDDVMNSFSNKQLMIIYHAIFLQTPHDLTSIEVEPNPESIELYEQHIDATILLVSHFMATAMLDNLKSVCNRAVTRTTKIWLEKFQASTAKALLKKMFYANRYMDTISRRTDYYVILEGSPFKVKKRSTFYVSPDLYTTLLRKKAFDESTISLLKTNSELADIFLKP